MSGFEQPTSSVAVATGDGGASTASRSPQRSSKQPTDSSLFLDTVTTNSSIPAGGPIADQSFLSCRGSELELSEARSTSIPPTGAPAAAAAAVAAIAENSSFARRGQAYRRTYPGPSTNTTPRARNLEEVAVSLKADLEMMNSPVDAPTAPAVGLTQAALAEHMESSSSFPSSTRGAAAAHDGTSLLQVLAPAAAEKRETTAAGDGDERRASAVGAGAGAFLTDGNTEGSVHVATGSQRGRKPRHRRSPEQDESAEWESGFELSMDAVRLHVAGRRFFRIRSVTYLDECTLHVAPGSMHCITSLDPVYARAALAVLAGVDAVASVEGAALANALPTSSLQYRRRVAYVASLDGCTDETTVYENIAFAARIRFQLDAATLREVVEQAAADVSLTDYLHTRASNLGPARRYLLATAMELVAEPAVLLLESPLSFFSLAELQLFMRLLHNMRARYPRRTVVWSSCAIPWTLFDSIDGLTLLTTGGRTFYTGSTKDVEAFLQQDLGILRVPAEDVVDIVAQTEVDLVAVAHATLSFHDSKYHREAQQAVEAHRMRIARNVYATTSGPVWPPPPYARVQSSLLLYTLRRNVVDKAALVPWIGLFAVMVVVCIFVAVAQEGEARNLQNTCGILFLLLSCSLQINSIFFKSELRDWRTFLSFKNNLYVSVTPYYIATLVRLVVPRLCFALAGSLCGALIFAQATAVSLSAMMSLLSFTHACLGLVVVYWCPRFDFLVISSYLYYGYCVIFSGFLVGISKIPTFFQLLSLLRIAYGGLLAKEVSGVMFGCADVTSSDAASSSSSSQTEPPSASCYSGEAYLLLAGLQNDSLAASALALSFLSLFMMGALGVSMYMASSARLFFST